KFHGADRTPGRRFSIISMGREDHSSTPPFRTVSYPPGGRDTRRGVSRPAQTRPRSLGWSLVLPGGRVDEMGLDVTRFFKRLCWETRRNSVQKAGFFLISRAPGPI